MERQPKNSRTLDIYVRLCEGKVINKAEEAAKFGVDERSIQRDIDDIRAFLDERSVTSSAEHRSIVYDRVKKGYILIGEESTMMTNSEILAVSKILLASRAFPKDEVSRLLDKLVSGCVPPKNIKVVTDLISNEEFHYVEPRHRTSVMDMMWDIGQAIRLSQYIEIDYLRMKDKAVVKRKLKPVAIMFSEYYFYLTAFIDDEEVRKDFDVINDVFPTIYRIDRIKNLKVLDERFKIPYRDRFEEGEFRKRIQFMYGGKLQKVHFKYTGPDIDAILDRLPTAQILSCKDGEYLVQAEVFGKGIDMWLKGQGDVEVIRR